MRWLLRLAVLASIAATALVLAAGIAAADITYTENAQREFGIDEDGNPQEGSDAKLHDAWQKFWKTIEGQRIHRALDRRPSVEITVDVLPPEQVGSGEKAGKAYGTAKILERDRLGRPAKILIKIRNDMTGGCENLADTIWHEFRHAEIYVERGGEGSHDDLDGEKSEENERFRQDVQTVMEAMAQPQTPIYDAIVKEAVAEQRLTQFFASFFDEISDAVDSISSNQPKYEGPDIDITNYDTLKVGYGDIGVNITFNESTFECGEVSDIRRVVCAGEALDMPAGEVLVAVMVLDADVPLASPERSYIYSAVFDSDGDPANDWVFVPPFDWDLFQGTDRWYQLIYDHASGSWFLTVTQLDASGEPRPVGASTVRAVIEGDTIVFFMSMTEFPSATPGFRLTAFGHDGFFSESDRGADVTGANPTEPLPMVGEEVIPAGF